MRYILFTISLSFILLSCNKQDVTPEMTIQDYDGNIYKTVKIGEQQWMAENLNMSKFNNGQENLYWTQSNYGKLYYSKALFSFAGGICPKGWHVPSNADWQTLFKYLGGNLKTVGAKLKKRGISGWSSNDGVTSGFNATPTGIAIWVNNKKIISNDNSITTFWGMDTLGAVTKFYSYSISDKSDHLTVNEAMEYSDCSCRCLKN